MTQAHLKLFILYCVIIGYVLTDKTTHRTSEDQVLDLDCSLGSRSANAPKEN
jgi:hypothetical protein